VSACPYLTSVGNEIAGWIMMLGFVKECRSRSVVVLTNIWNGKYLRTYRNDFFKLSGFLARAVSGSSAKNYENLFQKFWGRGWERIFLNPHISPNFGFRELRIYAPLKVHGLHLRSEVHDRSPKNGAWGDDRRNPKNGVFLQEGRM